MADQQPDLRELAGKLDALRQELAAQQEAVESAQRRIGELRERSDDLVAALESAMVMASAASLAARMAAPPVSAAPPPAGAPAPSASETPPQSTVPAWSRTTPATPAWELKPPASAAKLAPPAPLWPVSTATGDTTTGGPAFSAPFGAEAEIPEEPSPSANLETLIGSYWFGRLGALSLLVGFIFLAGYIQPRMTPLMRVGLCYLAAAVLCGIGGWFEAAYPKFSRPVLAAGMMLVFFTSFAGHFIRPMECFALSASTVLMLISAAAVIGVAARLRAQAFAVLALAMGFWIAVFATQLFAVFTPVMLLFLSVVGVALFLGFRWTTLLLLAVLGVYASHAWWMMWGEKPWTPTGRFWLELSYLTASFAAFLAGDLIVRLRATRLPLDSVWEKNLPAAECVVAARFANPIAYFLVASVLFMGTRVYYERIHWFYWPLGLVLAAAAVLCRRIEKTPSREDDVFYVMASGLITLGFASAFEAMSLSNVLALEGLCLFALRRITGRPIFYYLGITHYVIAFFQFNVSAFKEFRPAAVSDWITFAKGLPVVLFTLAPSFLTALWERFGLPQSAPDAPPRRSLFPSLSEWDEGILSHARVLAASLLFLRLCFETVKADVTFGLWVPLIVAVFAAAWAWPRVLGLWTLGGSFVFWAHGYLIPLLDKVRLGDPSWMFPAALALTLLVLAAGSLLERKTDRKVYRWTERLDGMHGYSVVPLVLLLVAAVLDVTLLVEKRASALFHYPMACVLAIALLALSAQLEVAFLNFTALILIWLGSVLQMVSLLGDDAGRPYFFVWTVAGAALTVFFEGCHRRWSPRLLEPITDLSRLTPVLLVGAVTVVLLIAVHQTPWIGGKYETPAITAVAVALLALGIVLQSATYRRFGIGVFAFALGRVYLVDLRQLETLYKIYAFIVLGAVLIGVSYFYTRYKEQFQKWI